MAPRGTPKQTPQIQRRVSRGKSSPAKTTTMSVKKTTETLRLKDNNKLKSTTRSTITNTVKETKITESRQRTRTEPSTPKPKENKPVVASGSVTKSGKKAAWRRRPKPAHSGVPVPEKMRKLLEKYLQDEDTL